MELTIQEAKLAVIDCFKAKLPIFITSSPGLGKSSLIHQIAEEKNCKVIDIRLAQLDPCELLGYPKIENNKATHIPFGMFPLKGDPLPKDKKGFILFLDEFSGASLSTQMAAYKLVLDRKVGDYDLHEKLHIVCAGNLTTDKAIVNRISTAMMSRLIHITISIDVESWLTWGIDKIDYRILSFIGFKPSALHQFNPDRNLETFPCPRTWSFLSKLIKDKQEFPLYLKALLCGTIGEGAALEFIGYCKIFEDLPTIKDILSKPETIHIPTEPSTLYAISGLLTEHLKESNADVMLKYISRLPIEFGVITLRNIIKRYPDSITYPAIKDWIKTYSKEIFL